MNPMRRACWSLLIAMAVLSGVAGTTRAGTSATPIYHGELGFTPAAGRIDRRPMQGHLATLKVRKWVLHPSAVTNGIDPASEPIVISLGEASWRLDPGMLIAAKNRRQWAYKLARGSKPTRAVNSLRVRLEKDGTYSFRFAITGIDGSPLDRFQTVCLPFAFIIGDDDAFSGVTLTSPSFNSTKLRAVELCQAPDWPWA